MNNSKRRRLMENVEAEVIIISDDSNDALPPVAVDDSNDVLPPVAVDDSNDVLPPVADDANDALSPAAAADDSNDALSPAAAADDSNDALSPAAAADDSNDTLSPAATDDSNDTLSPAADDSDMELVVDVNEAFDDDDDDDDAADDDDSDDDGNDGDAEDDDADADDANDGDAEDDQAADDDVEEVAGGDAAVVKTAAEESDDDSVIPLKRKGTPIRKYVEDIFMSSAVKGMTEIMYDNNGERYYRVLDRAVEKYASATTIREKFAHRLSDVVTVRDFAVIKCLGNGASAKIYLVRKRGGVDHNAIYAMKVISKDHGLHTNISCEHMANERRILAAVRGKPFLSQMHYAFQSKYELYIILDYVGGGDLFLHLSQAQRFDENKVRFYIAQVFVALETLHEIGMVHRDIKLENILMDTAGNLVISDFGAAVNVNTPERKAISVCGSMEYMAPELLLRSRLYDRSTDWWALGVLTFEFLCGASPYTVDGSKNNRNSIAIRVLKMKAPSVTEASEVTNNFVMGLMIKDRLKRLGCRKDGPSEIQNHEFFRNINWDDIKAKRVTPPIIPNIVNETDTQNFADEYTQQPREIVGCPRIENTEAFFKGYDFVAPHIVKANKYYRELNAKSGSKIGVPYVPSCILQVPVTNETLKFQTKNQKFFQKYQFCNDSKISYGAYSMVIECEDRNTKIKYACKIANTITTTQNQIDKLYECQGHPNVVTMVEYIVERKCTFIIMELVKGKLLSDRFTKRLPNELEIFKIFEQMIKVTEFIHSKDIAHCDLDLRHFMFTSKSSLQIKLIGFGSASDVKDNIMFDNMYLKPRFKLECSAPETIKFYERQLDINDGINPNTGNEYSCLRESDLWSIGIILYRLLCNEYPFFSKPSSYEMTKAQIFAGEIKDKVKFSELDENLKTLICQLVNVNPLGRLNFAQIRLNDWFVKQRRLCYLKRTRKTSVAGQRSSKPKKPRN